MARLPVDDGSFLVLADLVVVEDQDEDEALTLGPVGDFLQQVAFDGAFIGIVGNASFATLLAIGHRLRKHGILPSRAQPPTLDEVRERVGKALTEAGHPGPVFTDIAQHADQGWELSGTVGASAFTARADPRGQVIHLRVS